MKKEQVILALNSELKRTYHNATLRGCKYAIESDYEQDLVQNEIQFHIEVAFENLKYDYPEILDYGQVYQWGRGGRTVAPEKLIIDRGFGFRMASLEDLDLNYIEMKKLLRILKKFNDSVIEFCSNVENLAIEEVRENFSDEIEQNKNKKRQHYSGVRYVEKA